MFKFLLGCYTINNKNSVPVVYKVIRKYCITESNIRKSYIIDECRNRKIFALHAVESGISRLRQLTLCQQTRFLNINTHVKNNVFLFKHEDLAKSHRNVLIVSFVQLFFWAGIGAGQYYLSWGDISNDLSWFDFAKKYRLQLIVFLFTIAAGPLVLIAACTLITRSVKYVILNRGGKEATIVTYHPFKKENRFTVPIKMISTKGSRNDASTHVALKVQGRYWNFLLEKNGMFVNPDLFDCTVGQRRVSR